MFAPDTRILIVDDSQGMRAIVSGVCRELGFRDFIEAAHGGQAWRELLAADPAIGLIICDVVMPGVDGIEFVKMVRQEPRFSLIPFLILTAEGEQSAIIRAVKAGTDAFLLKPFDVEALRAALASLYEKVKGRR